MVFFQLKQEGTTSNQLVGEVFHVILCTLIANNSSLTFLLTPRVLFSFCPVPEKLTRCTFTQTPPPRRLFSWRPCDVKPCLWREWRRVMFGLSVWLLVSVSGAAGSSDSAGGAAGPSRVQPSPCDTLSVTDPLHLVTWHPPPASLLTTLVLQPPLASGLFAATRKSLTQAVT